MRSGLIAASVFVTGVVLACSAAGCSSTVTPGPVETHQEQGTPAPQFSDGTGQAATTPAAYPAGPYGYVAGSIIPNFEFFGFPNPKTNRTQMRPIHLSDFYNPHAFDKSYTPAAGEQDDRLFPSSSLYAEAGKQKPTVLLVDIASVWCGPCNEEANHVLPFKHNLYAPCGGEFFLNLHDSYNQGVTADTTDLKNWTGVYGVNFPSVVDPDYRLDLYFSQDAFPNNMIIDTTTMKIVYVVAGESVPGVCNDPNQDLCGTPADLAACSATGIDCGGLAGCPAGSTCQQYDFWTTYEKHLDKTRTGCTVQ